MGAKSASVRPRSGHRSSQVLATHAELGPRITSRKLPRPLNGTHGISDSVLRHTVGEAQVEKGGRTRE
jgi:hypothetical protein